MMIPEHEASAAMNREGDIMVFGFLGIGIVELIILGAVGGAIVGVVIYLFSGSGKDDD
jgi:hypothetical protein